MASLQELITAWNTGPEEPLKEFYDEVFDGDGYAADPEGQDYIGQDKLPDELIAAAVEMANTLNGVKAIFEQPRITDQGTFGTTSYSLSGEDQYWPRLQNPDLENAVAVVQTLVASLLVLQESPLFYQPYHWGKAFLGGTEADTREPPSYLQELTEAVIAGSATFLEAAGAAVSLKPEAPPAAETQGLGPAPIISDLGLESSLFFAGNQTHYIGFLLDADKSDGARDQRYLPVRLSPDAPEEGLSMGWANQNYSLIDNSGDLVKPKNKDSDGIEIPLGLEIKVVEIVPSKTGVWVGFISNDARLADLPDTVGTAGLLQGRWDVITKGQTRLLYTKAQYVRIKEGVISTNPDPYLSERAMIGDDLAAATAGVQGSDPVSPKDNQNWITLRPNDVRLSYYSFKKHNLKVIAQGDEDELLYNESTLADFPTLRYSEGYYYFILGEKPRKSEAELINESNNDLETSQGSLDAAKAASGAETAASTKEEAWSNLLSYLGKNTEGGNSFLYQKLYDEYFIEVAKKLNTNTANPNNQKVLYAIRASYIDSLPEPARLYTEDFSSDSPYLAGNTTILSLEMGKIKDRCEYLARNVLSPIKSKIEASKKTVENANGTDFDMDVQILLMEDLPFILDRFFNRQAFPSSMNKSRIHDLVSEGINTSDTEHRVQIGIRDNGEVGGNVRETISYVLFSPNPEKLKESGKKDSDLYYLDPYITQEELSGDSEMDRSAIPLRVALPWLRGKLEGVYASRALHLLLSYDKIKSKLDDRQTDLQKDWPELMSNFFVPPVRIYHSKDPSLLDPEQLDCDEIIKKLNKTGPNATLEERQLMNKLYSSSECAEKYFNQFKDPTPAVSPGMTKQELEKKSEQAAGKGGSVLDNQYVKTLYTGFFNSLDVQGMMGLIMACLEHKIGVPLTAEAICEQIIIELVKDKGPGPVENVMLMNALLNPDSERSKKYIEEYYKVKYGELPPFVTEDTLATPENLDQVAATIKDNTPSDPNNAGAATALGKKSLDISYNDAPVASTLAMGGWTSGEAVEKIKNMEKGGVYIELVPGPRPDGEGTVYIPGSSLLPNEYAKTATYTEEEIENEKRRLMRKGYSESQARVAMVASRHLIINPVQYESLLGEASFSSPGGRFSQTFSLDALAGSADPSLTDDQRANVVEAELWLQQLKGVVGLVGVCELIVGQILDGLQDLIKDPGAFFSGGGGNWWEDFKDSLKRQFSFKIPTMKFPDSLSTDNHMGDYGEQLLKAILSMIAQMLGQIVRLLLVNALEQCLEENNDVGVLGKPSPVGPDIPFPVLERANLPRFDNIDPPDVVAWMKDILDNLATSQLCALLRGDATKQTLNNCLARTREYWPIVYSSGIDTIYDIRVAFEKIGRDLDLEICDVLESPALVDDLCDAVFDRDARCQQLLGKGLTEEECQVQIDREIDDLKSKVAGLTSLSMLDINPLSLSFPPICGEGGSFAVPPGVKDTMNRITDNMLTNVKGSLLIDMTGLKFFSTPPRALMAMSDPNELKKAHQMFLDMAESPYVKDCIVLIGDPTHHLNRVASGKGYLQELHPITYNKYVHYGNFSTWNIRSSKAMTISDEDKVDVVDVGTGINLGVIGFNALTVGLNAKSTDIIRASEPDENGLRPLQEDIKNYWKAASSGGDKIRGSATPEQFFDKNSLTPLNAGLFTTHNKYLDIDVTMGEINSAGARKKLLRDYIMEREYSNFSLEEVVENIYQEFDKEIQSPILDVLRAAPKDALSSEVLSAGFFPGNLRQKFFGSKDKLSKYGATLKKVYSLDTKLKEISPDPNRWYIMMRNYTGVDISPYIKGGGKGHGGSQRQFPEKWLANAYIGGEDLIGGALFDENNPQAFIDAFYKKIVLSSDDVGATLGSVSTGFDETGETFKQFNQSQEEIDKYLTDADKIGLTKDNLHWLNWLKMSPGLRNLIRIAIERQRKGENVLYEVPGLEPELPDKLLGYKYRRENHNLAFAFMELTVAEAAGLEEHRLRSIFPATSFNLSNSPGIVFNIDDGFETAVVKKITPDLAAGPAEQTIVNKDDTLATVQTGDTTDTAEGFIPHFLVFQKTFRDPDSPLNSDFSLNEDKVNQELYDFFNFIPSPMLPGQVSRQEMFSAAYGDGTSITDQTNFNITSLKYDLPFTEITAQTAPGIDGQGKVAEIMEVFSAPEAGEQIKELADSLQILQTSRSLINQSILTPLRENEAVQLDSIKNISKLVKATIPPSSAYNLSAIQDPFPGHDRNIVAKDAGIEQEIYNFNFAEKLDPDVLTLIDSLLSQGEGMKGVIDTSDARASLQDLPIETLNLKSQIFGHFLSKKLDTLLEEHSFQSLSGQDVDALRNDLWKNLVIHGYPALQYAYSTQMFAKLRESRLQYRGFMKKLWKKILKSPLHSDGVDPRCKQLFDQIGAPSVQELDKTETDFFNIGEVKSKIIEFYEKSLCRDVYESNQQGIDSTRISLLEGMIKLVMKIYTLEMCLASVIAWDSFDLNEVIKDRAFISIIIQNISDDFNLEFVSFYATDLLRKEESLTDIQLAKLRQGDSGARISSIEYLIEKEAKSISAIIKNLFTNSFPLSTDLTLDLIKNSDLDLMPSLEQLYGSTKPIILDNAPQYGMLSSIGGLEYVMSARIKNNIYSMNYGDGEVYNFNTGHEEFDADNNKADLYGLTFEKTGKQNKNYFQSLPMTWKEIEKPDFTGIVHPPSTNFPNLNDEATNQEKGFATNTINGNRQQNPDSMINSYRDQNVMFGAADSFSKEFTPEHTPGNDLNALLGNVSFQPFVHVIDYGEDEERDYSFREYDKPQSSSACDLLGVGIGYEDLTVNAVLDELKKMFNDYRTENAGDDKNNLGCQFYSPGEAGGVYVPLSVWSHFYKDVFIKNIYGVATDSWSSYFSEPISATKTKQSVVKALFEEFGLDPFFKKVSFGMRMVYTTAADQIVNEDLLDYLKGGAPVLNRSRLRDIKTLYTNRLYNTSDADHGVDAYAKVGRPELQIPIVEIKKEIKSHEGVGTISVGGGDAFSIEEMSYYREDLSGLTKDLLLTDTGRNFARSSISNPHQFFYKNVAQDLLKEVKQSPEFKLMFEYLFPMRRYMAMATIVASDGLSRFIPEPTTVLEKTKGSLQMIIENINNSTDYKQTPDAVANMMADFAMRSEAGTSGKEPDMTKEILKILYRTPLLVLKGFVEVTDPAIITAKRIIDIAFAIQQATIATAKQTLEQTKQVTQSGIDAANMLMQNIEMNIKLGVGLIDATLSTIDASTGALDWSAKPEYNSSSGTSYAAGEPIKFSDRVKSETDASFVGDWKFNIDISADEEAWLKGVAPDIFEQWDDFKKQYTKLETMAIDFGAAAEEAWPGPDGQPMPPDWDPAAWEGVQVPGGPGDLVKTKRTIEKDIDVVVRKAENTMKDLFSSPYLLPSMWAAMVPSVIPLGGGINPWPMPPPFISTVPGMIYIALLLIDEIEEKMHDDQESKLSSQPPNCIEQL